MFRGKRTDKAEEEGLDHSWKGNEGWAQSCRPSLSRLRAGGRPFSAFEQDSKAN